MEQSQLYPSSGGVSNVAYQLTRALAEKIRITCYPKFIPQRSFAIKLLNIYSAMKNFDVIHFNLSPIWINGGNMLFAFSKITGAPTLLNIHGIYPVSYTHLTLPTNREV